MPIVSACRWRIVYTDVVSLAAAARFQLTSVHDGPHRKSSSQCKLTGCDNVLLYSARC